MTTETSIEAAPETMFDPYADTQCSFCSGPVRRRRPSLTGQHFCAKKDCQRAKHRYYHRRRVEEAAQSEAKLAQTHQKLLVNFIGNAFILAANDGLIDCETCGRPGIVPRYAHPNPDWSGACNPPDKLPVSGDPLLTQAIMTAMYPR